MSSKPSAFLHSLPLTLPSKSFSLSHSQCLSHPQQRPQPTLYTLPTNRITMNIQTPSPTPQYPSMENSNPNNPNNLNSSSSNDINSFQWHENHIQRRKMMDVEEQGLFGEVIRRAREMNKSGDVSGARGMYEEIVGRWMWDVRGWLEYAKFEDGGGGDVEKAGVVYERGCVGCGGGGGRLVGELWVRWVKWELGFGRVAKAKEILKRGCGLLKGRCGGVLWGMWGGLEKGETARRVYESGVRCAGKDPCLWQAWACFEESVGNVGRARQIFERGVLVDAGFASMWQGWALLEEREGNFEKARELFKRGVEADESDAPTWQAWGRMEAKLRDHDKARSLFRDAADRVQGRGAGALYLSWGMLEVKSRNYPVARSVFQEGLRKEEDVKSRNAVRNGQGVGRGWKGVNKRRVSDYGRLLHAWGKMEVYTGNIDEARRLFKAALLENSRDMHVVHALARIETKAGDHEGARTLLRRGRELAPADTYIVQALANIEWMHFAHEGGCERARLLYEDGIRAKPTDSGLLRGWAELEYVHGDRDLSRRLRGLSLRCSPRGGMRKR